MKIRKATYTDAGPISALATTLSEIYVTPEFPTNATKPFLNSMTPQAIENNIKNGFQYHVAEIDAQVIACIGIKDNCHLYHFFVSENYQRNGVARKLWHVAKETCIADGNGNGFTVNASRCAKGFYEKLGFVAQSQPQQRNGVITIPMKFTISD